MKQNIKKEQWDELSDEQKEGFYGKFRMIYGTKVPSSITTDLPTIGQMIEFLGDDLHLIREYDGMYYVDIVSDNLECLDTDCCGYHYQNKELCDALYEAVKEKLKE